MFYWNGDHMGGWGYALMSISMVLFWGLVILAIIALVRYSANPGPRRQTPASPPSTTPEQLLAERFARGEIDTEEYRERLDTLHGHVPENRRPSSEP